MELKLGNIITQWNMGEPKNSIVIVVCIFYIIYFLAFTLLYIYSAMSYLLSPNCIGENLGFCTFAEIVNFTLILLPFPISIISFCGCFAPIFDDIKGILTCLLITSVFVVIHLAVDIILFIVTLIFFVESQVTYGTLVALPCLSILNILILIWFGLGCVYQCIRKIISRKRRSELPFERSELPSHAEIPARGPAKTKRLQKPTPVIKSTNIQEPTPVIKSTNTQRRAIRPALIKKDMLFSNQNIERDNPVEIRIIRPVYYKKPYLTPQTLPDSPVVSAAVESIHPDSPDPVVSKHPNSSVYDIPDIPVVPVPVESVHSGSPDPDPDPVVSKYPNSSVYDIPDIPVVPVLVELVHSDSPDPDPDPDPVASKHPNSPVYDIPDIPVLPVAIELVHSDSLDPDPVESKHPNSLVYDTPNNLVVPVAIESIHSDSPDPDLVVSKHPNSSVYDIPDSTVTV